MSLNRDAEVVAAYKAGAVLQEVANKFLLTRERVRQILVLNGVVERHHGNHISEEARIEKRERERAEYEQKKRLLLQKQEERRLREEEINKLREARTLARPPRVGTAQINFFMPLEKVIELEKTALRLNTSKSFLIREAIDFYLTSLQKEDPK